ncbi:MAG: ATP-binding protein [Anaerolineae bacterium]
MGTAVTTAAVDHDGDTVEAFKDLVRESLRFLWPITLIIAYLWAVFTVTSADEQSGPVYIVLAVLGLTVWTSHILQKRYLNAAIIAFVSGLSAAVTIIAIGSRSIAPLYLYAQVVIIAAMLTNARWTWAITAGSVAMLLALGRIRMLSVPDLILPASFVLLTALTSWLGARRLYTALAWALNMTHHAQRSAAEARAHRAEVQRMLISLDDAYVRLERANEALMFAREAAEKAYRFKAEFVANVSHELRTPLNLIVGFSEMMATAPESYGGVALPAPYRGDVMATYRSARHLSDLINDVLDLSQIETGKMPLAQEAASLTEIAHEAIEIVRGLAEARGLGLEVDIPPELPQLLLDRTRIRQVFLNLLTNALRFTQEGHIRVRVRVEGREAVVAVEDTGCGIPVDRMRHAFEAFGRMSDDQERTGSGLGLAVSKRFIEMHGGRMWLESTIGQGTTVYFSLAIAHEGLEVRISPLVRSAPRQVRVAEPRVLVLHDDVRTVETLRRHIQGCNFVFADSVSAAESIIHDEAVAAVVTDMMPGQGQDHTTGSLSLPRHIPLITCPLPSMRRIGLLLGAVDYLPKPVTRQALLDALGRLPQTPRKVLVVDDDVHIVRLLTRMARTCDDSLQILEAYGGKEGLQAARTHHPDVILLDLYMPGMTGAEMLDALSRDESMAGTQAIIVSVRTVEQESHPVQGEVRLRREMGFTLTEMLQLLQDMLSVVTQSGAVSPSSAEAAPEGQLG